MATRAQKAKVGAFLLLSAAVIVAGALFISHYGQGGQVHYFVNFHESVLGLSAGSPVVYMGLPIGVVDDMDVSVGSVNGQETFVSRVDLLVNVNDFTLREGVTAKLSIYSLATGTLVVYLQGGDPTRPPLPPGATIPVEPSLLESVTSRVEDVLEDVGAIANQLRVALAGVEEGQIASILRNLDSFTEEARGLTSEARTAFNDLRGQAETGVNGFNDLVEEVRTLATDTSTLVRNINEKLEPLDVGETQTRLNEVLAGINQLTGKLNQFTDKLGTTTETVSQDVDGISYAVREGLRSMSEALDSLRVLVEELRQDPASVIRGRGRQRGGE